MDGICGVREGDASASCFSEVPAVGSDLGAGRLAKRSPSIIGEGDAGGVVASGMEECSMFLIGGFIGCRGVGAARFSAGAGGVTVRLAAAVVA